MAGSQGRRGRRGAARRGSAWLRDRAACGSERSRRKGDIALPASSRSRLEPLALPAPVYAFGAGSADAGPLFVKDDGAIHPLYGGNKTRKLARVLADVERRGARRIVTFGAAGSHHVLATAAFARERGLAVSAFLATEPATQHAERVLRAIVGQGTQIHPLRALPGAARALGALRRGDYWLAPGGASLPGLLAYADAARELEQQVEAGLVPEPDELVVALGSGTTAAGLLAGLAVTRLRTRLVAVQVTANAAAHALTLALAARTLHALGMSARELAASLAARVSVERGELGRGYGFPTARGERATSRALEAGLVLDPTYTAKAFACALGRATPGRVVVYWHTLSSAPLEPLLTGAPTLDELAPPLRRLLRPLGASGGVRSRSPGWSSANRG